MVKACESCLHHFESRIFEARDSLQVVPERCRCIDLKPRVDLDAEELKELFVVQAELDSGEVIEAHS
jgi:hypothetical protein